MRATAATVLVWLIGAGTWLATAPPALAHERPLPAAWHFSKNYPDDDDYEVGLTDTDSHSGKFCGYVKSGLHTPKGWGDVNQRFSAERYLGKRLRFSAWVKAIKVKGNALIWMRVDGVDHRIMAFDAMNGHRISGTTAWKRYDIVLDVPPKSAVVNFGVELQGEGAICFDDMKFDVVASTIPTTDGVNGLPGAPSDLDFEK